MTELKLLKVSAACADLLESYRAAFPAARERVTYLAERIPGLDHLEECQSLAEWLDYCQSMEGKISWYLSVRESDGKAVGCACLRHRLEYDDDDPEFCSHIGYSIRPDERQKGYAREQLRLVLEKAREAGLKQVRILCLDTNEGSRRTILANGGVYVDSLYGEESGLTVLRFDVPTA